VATIDECEQALHGLAARLATADATTRKKASLDRTLSCHLTDLGVSFAGRLRNGALEDIYPAGSSSAQVRLSMTSDDLLRLAAGELALVPAWASGRIKIRASVLDLLALRSAF
jgi:hypothetical protein